VTQWYIHRNGRQSGPFSSQQLKNLASRGDLDPSDHIWKDGMKDWAEASRLKGLFVETPEEEDEDEDEYEDEDEDEYEDEDEDEYEDEPHDPSEQEKSHAKAANREQWQIFAVGLPLLGKVIGLVCAMFFTESGLSENKYWILWGAVIGLVVGLIILINKKVAACPYCGLYSQEDSSKAQTELLGSHKAYKTVERTDTTQINGKDSLKTKRTEQVRVLKTHWRLHFTCENCGNTWTGERSDETENFVD
jgi:hypothetical protein